MPKNDSETADSPIDVRTLTRVGKGTPMGEFMRQYWVPALMSSELERDREPIRLMLLGEKLIAFRDSSGRVGIFDERCPHRGVSLFLGRNEADGLRCVYHGWKFDTSGRCVDMPNLPAQQGAVPKVRAKAYPATEQAGLVWVYMGSRQTPPPMPRIEAAMLPHGDATVYAVLRECNWLQMTEGDLDTSHFGFLHTGSVDPEEFDEDNPIRYTTENRAPVYVCNETPWGTSYGAHRETKDGQIYWRIANYMFPFWAQTPLGDFDDHIDARAFVPMDDEHTMQFHIAWSKKSKPMSGLNKRGEQIPGLTIENRYLPNTTDWFGRWRSAFNRRNDWLIDRKAQREGVSYTGIADIRAQDQAALESMGPIVSHADEHLMASDLMIVKTRRRIIRALQDFVERGTPPPGVDDPEIFFRARSGTFFADPAVSWPEVVDRKWAGVLHLDPA
ncbi:MAG: Rieske 2Fe-2S domain-containing protein [Bradyrhizobium sp.]|uniref:Rieske 2Fe-2S domain-containing protein n=1 Tax=Bradyrhizobium sp. TaxID=376 RepID=UPI003D0C1650